MSEPTEQDRETAREIAGCERDGRDPDFPFCWVHDEDGNPRWDKCRWAPIAAALAAERDKARAPFLALADELDVEMGTDDGVAIPSRTAYRIRRAAEDAL